MSRVFADTSFYVAMLNPRDAHHAAVQAWTKDSTSPIVVTEFILLELANLFAGGPTRVQTRAFLAGLEHDPDTLVIPLSHELLAAGLELYGSRPDKHWSLTDCVSFVVMKEQGLTEALTTDHHFEQAGFKALLR